MAEDGKGGPQTPYPAYENGACFILMTGLELAALGATGDLDAAYDRFALAMAKFKVTQLWSQNIRWDLGNATHNEVSGGDISQVHPFFLTSVLSARYFLTGGRW